MSAIRTQGKPVVDAQYPDAKQINSLGGVITEEFKNMRHMIRAMARRESIDDNIVKIVSTMRLNSR
jgi:hypothetical protein